MTRSRSTPLKKYSGFSLLELLIAIVIVGILASVAYPSYVDALVKSKRRAAQACLSNYAQYMERYYTANMRYDENAAGTDNTLPALDCATNQNTGEDYSYSLSAVARSTYSLSATPRATSVQSTRDSRCGTLTLNQAGTRGASGSAGVDSCW